MKNYLVTLRSIINPKALMLDDWSRSLHTKAYEYQVKADNPREARQIAVGMHSENTRLGVEESEVEEI